MLLNIFTQSIPVDNFFRHTKKDAKNTFWPNLSPYSKCSGSCSALSSLFRDIV
jgi:hypothetical protein